MLGYQQVQLGREMSGALVLNSGQQLLLQVTRAVGRLTIPVDSKMIQEVM